MFNGPEPHRVATGIAKPAELQRILPSRFEANSGHPDENFCSAVAAGIAMHDSTACKGAYGNNLPQNCARKGAGGAHEHLTIQWILKSVTPSPEFGIGRLTN
ncbi:hypothetical protein CupriaWKF_32325 [Cupriavidus sp. WKF15]|uniref:hypothetical protein n=1 Tax=Cupriavidus sp. WKF15 TaxID=3032282 RepID=UPI0023E20A65|nr:hypothetical protein [Cupriavidus sp. WKF15]WER50282.1 hypothetical protein CupriaWKF_32325 [Cupriavidus sp. WKF15]